MINLAHRYEEEEFRDIVKARRHAFTPPNAILPPLPMAPPKRIQRDYTEDEFRDLVMYRRNHVAPAPSGGTTIFPLVPVFSYPVGSLPKYTDDNFLEALLALMPHGRVWAKYPSSTLYQTAETLVHLYTLNVMTANQLLVDIFPPTTQQLLIDWEKSLGLPDDCSGPFTSTEAARNQVVAKFISNGGQSIPYILLFMKTLGFDITITESPRAFTAGVSVAGGPDPAAGDGSEAFIWYVTAPEFTMTVFRAGQSAAGDSLGTFLSNQLLECTIRALAPAQTFVIFNYSTQS